jgi:hypothetical protein
MAKPVSDNDGHDDYRGLGRTIAIGAGIMLAAGLASYAVHLYRPTNRIPSAQHVTPGKKTLSEKDRQEVDKLMTIDPWTLLHYQQNVMPNPERLYEGLVSIRFTDPDVQPSQADKGWGNCALKCGFEPYQGAKFTVLHYTGQKYRQYDKNVIEELKKRAILTGDVTANTTIFIFDGKRVDLTPAEQKGVDEGNEQLLEDLVKKFDKH